MLEHCAFFPLHVRDLISELQSSVISDSILLKYHCKTISDPILSRVYINLNYPDSQEIPSEQVISILMNEYLHEFPPIDLEAEEFKESFARIYYENNINAFFEPLDLGIDTRKQETFEVVSLFSLWSEETSASPNKTPGTSAPKTTLRSKNGLKVLSWKVKEIAQRLGSSTYQEVADILVKEAEDSSIEPKDEKNIRRRVYDALNVLIAVGILHKNGKKVEAIRPKQTAGNEKLKRLKLLTEKYLNLKGLIERNQVKHQTTQSLYLPFNLIIINKKSEKSVKMLADIQRTNVSLSIDQEFSIQSSDEVLQQLNININYSWLPIELNSLFNTQLCNTGLLM